VNDANDVGIRIGSNGKVAVTGNNVTNRNNVSGNDRDYRLNANTYLLAVANLGATRSVFSNTAQIVANNEFV